MNDKSTTIFNDNFDHKEYKHGLKCRRKSLRETKKKLKKLVNDYTGYDFSELHNIVMEIILDMWVIYRFQYGITTTDEESERIAKQLWEVLTLDSKIKAAEIDHTTPLMMEANLYKKLYSKIGEYITGWWD